jgi:hypothetical protein
MENPFSSEDAAFRLLLRVLVVMAVVVGVVLLVRALT